MNCAKCGYQNCDGAQLCSQCDNDLQVQTKLAMATERCPACGSTYRPYAKFCPACLRSLTLSSGAPSNDDGKSDGPVVSAPRESLHEMNIKPLSEPIQFKTKWFFWGGILLCIFAIGGYFSLKKGASVNQEHLSSDALPEQTKPKQKTLAEEVPVPARLQSKARDNPQGVSGNTTRLPLPNPAPRSPKAEPVAVDKPVPKPTSKKTEITPTKSKQSLDDLLK